LRVVVPVGLLMLPTAVLLALALTRSPHPRLVAARAAARRALLPLACVASGALALPVMITSAEMLETETFMFTYVLGAGFLLQAAVCALPLRPLATTSTSSAAASR